MGIPLDIQFVNEMMPFITALGISYDSFFDPDGAEYLTTRNLLIPTYDSECYKPRYVDDVEVLALDPETIDYLLEDLEKYKVFDNIYSYMNGGSFNDTLKPIIDATWGPEMEWNYGEENIEAIFLCKYVAANHKSSWAGDIENQDIVGEFKNKKFQNYLNKHDNLNDFMNDVCTFVKAPCLGVNGFDYDNDDFEKIYEKQIKINDDSIADGFYMCFMRKV